MIQLQVRSVIRVCPKYFSVGRAERENNPLVVMDFLFQYTYVCIFLVDILYRCLLYMNVKSYTMVRYYIISLTV